MPAELSIANAEGYFSAMAEAHGSESAPSPRKKAKKAQLPTNRSAEGRAKQFSEDFYANGGVVFCRFCNHSVDFMRVDTKRPPQFSTCQAKNEKLKKETRVGKYQLSL